MTVYEDQVLQDLPKGYWKLDETSGSTATDSSGNGKHGTYTGTPSLSNRTLTGTTFPKVADFDGTDDWVDVPALGITGWTAFTLEAWVVSDVNNNGASIVAEALGAGKIIASLGLGQSTGSDTNWSTMTYDGSNGDVNNLGTPPSTATLYHVVSTCDGSTYKLYINGQMVQQVSGTRVTSSRSDNDGWRIGRRFDASQWWNGAIGHVAVYDTALTGARVTAHYGAGFYRPTLRDTVLKDGPALYWPMDESSGTTVADVSGNSRSGTEYGDTGTELVLGTAAIVADDLCPTWTPGNAYYASNSDTNDTGLDVGTGDFAYELWTKLNMATGATYEIFSRDDTAGNGVILFTDSATGAPRVHIANATSYAGTVRITDNALHHVVISRISGTARVYVDGVLDLTVPSSSGSVDPTTRKLRLGYVNGSFSFPAGKMSNFAMYKVGLTAAQVRAHYRAGLDDLYGAAVLEDNPVGYWQLKESSGSTAKDLVGAFDGTYTGSPTLANRTLTGAGGLGGDYPNFDGTDDYVDIPAIGAASTTRSIEAWAIIDTAKGSLISEKNLNNVELEIGYDLQNGTNTSYFQAGTSWSPFASTTPDTAPSTATLHHFVATADNSWVRLYIDGVEFGKVSTNLRTSNSGWVIGRRHTLSASFGNYWDGVIGHAAIYSTCLTPAQVAEHYFAGLYSSGSQTLTMPVIASPETMRAPIVPTIILGGISNPETMQVPVVKNATVLDTSPIDMALSLNTPALREQITITTEPLSLSMDLIGRTRFPPVGLPTEGRSRYRIEIVSSFNTPPNWLVRHAELENAEIVEPLKWTLNEGSTFKFRLPVGDDKTNEISAPDREVRVWMGRRLVWWGPMIRTEENGDHLVVSCRDLSWYFSRRHFGRANRRVFVANQSFEQGRKKWGLGWFPAEALANRKGISRIDKSKFITGSQSLYMEAWTGSVGSPVDWDYSAQQGFIWIAGQEGDADPELGELWKASAWCWIPSSKYGGPNPINTGFSIIRASTTEGVVVNTPYGPQTIPKTISSGSIPINENTPRDKWIRMEIELKQPPTGQAEFVVIALACPNGAVYWDNIRLSRREASAWFSVDQVEIAKGIVNHAQDVAYDKASLNIEQIAPASTGVIKTRVYYHEDHGMTLDAINEFPTLHKGMDWRIGFTATKRWIEWCYPKAGSRKPWLAIEEGKNLVDFTVSVDGERTANSIVVMGEDGTSEREEAGAIDDTTMGTLILEKVYRATPGSEVASLQLQATRGLNRFKHPVTIPEVVIDNPEDVIGDLSPGDIIPIKLTLQAPTPVALADTFTRSDSASSAGPMWTNLAGTWGVSSNKGYVATGSGAANLAVVDLLPSFVTVTAQLSAANPSAANGCGITVAGVNSTNHLSMIWVNAFSVWVIFEVIAGVLTNIGNTGASNPFYPVSLSYNSSNGKVRGVVNGVGIPTTTSANVALWSAGKPGIATTITPDASARWDDVAVTGLLRDGREMSAEHRVVGMSLDTATDLVTVTLNPLTEEFL